MTRTTLAKFLLPPIQRPSTKEEVRAAGLLPPEEEICEALDDLFLKPLPCVPEWFCTTGKPQSHNQLPSMHKHLTQVDPCNTQPTAVLPMVSLEHGTATEASNNFTTEIWKLAGFPKEKGKLVMGQQVRFTHKSDVRIGYLKKVFALEKFWVAIQVGLEGAMSSLPTIVLLYAPICVVTLPRLQACIHRITFPFRRAIGKEVDWPTGQLPKAAPSGTLARVDLSVPKAVHRKPSVGFNEEVQKRTFRYIPSLDIASSHPVSIERNDSKLLMERTAWDSDSEESDAHTYYADQARHMGPVVI
ncbi:hypothetical protein BKA70DRAFT_1217860 [Coprinopsis sp. MPI-PUGE-AT-0042]|nr:hypothetical protein BKA70DRAFT_1217860 [Coprinopsis sp. MPI-PUGE-AT-0042]